MNTSFFSRLPAGHDVRKYNKATARHMLDDDSRVVVSLDNLTVASLREFCAAILWLNDSSPVLLSDIESLSPNERSALCRLLGLVEAGVPAAVSRRILASLAGHAPPPPPPPTTPSFYNTLLSSHPELDGPTPAIRRLAQDCSFPCQPGDRKSAQENAAMRLWCEHGLLQASDVAKLPAPLRSQIELAHNVNLGWPDHLRADTLFALVDTWRKRAGRIAAISPPSPAPPPSPPVYMPPGGAIGFSPPQIGSQMAAGGFSGMHMPPGGGGGIFNTNFYGTGYHSGAMWPLTLGLHNLSLNVNTSQPPLPNPLAGTFFQASNPGPNPLDWLRSEGDKRLAMLQQLHAPVLDLLSDAEQKQLLNANKVSTVMSPSGTTSGTTKPAPTTIYAEYPWNQPLRLYPGHGATAQGRQVQIALRVDAANFGGPNDQLVRSSRLKTESALLYSFDTAFSERKAAECFLHKEAITRHMIEQSRINALSAAEDASRFPQLEFGAIALARRTQHEQMPLFLHSVAEQITTRSEGKHKQRSQVGMWKQFIDGWRHSAQASAQRAAALALTSDWGDDDDDDAACGSGAPDTDSDDSAPAARNPPRGKGTPRQTPKPKPAKEKPAVSPTFPASKEVIGAALGLDPPGGNCRHCQQSGHFHSDCPVRWAQRGHPLPGFSNNGRRIRGAWVDGNPTKETFAAWVRFWKNSALFGSGPTVRDGAPDLQAIKKAAREGPPP